MGYIFQDPDLLNAYPATYIWRSKLRQQNGYYTHFFWGPDETFTGAGYYGAHPYPNPPPSGSAHNWEVSANGNDYITGDGGVSTVVAYDLWKTQALRVSESGGTITLKYFFDLADTTKTITQAIGSYAAGFPAPSGTYGDGDSPGLMWGYAPWNTGNENLCGVLRASQIYTAALSGADLVAAAALETDAAVSGAAITGLWYCNMNPTPSDISDKCGGAHDPAWINANRPAQWDSSTSFPGKATLLGVGRP